MIANKLWWEFWPRETAAEELDGSLERMGLDYLDLVYSERPPDGLPVAEVVIAVSELIASGKVRAWGLLNWRHELAAAAIRFASVEGLPAPCAAQLPYSLAYPEFVEDETMSAALDAAGARVVASAVLANGALTGKYATADGAGRLSTMLDDPRRRKALEIGRRLRTTAAEHDDDSGAVGDRLRARKPAGRERALRCNQSEPGGGQRAVPSSSFTA